MHFGEWLNFLKFIRTKAGKDALSELIHQSKLEARNDGLFGEEENGVLSTFDAQRNDFLRWEKEIRQTGESETLNLQLCCKKLERELRGLRDDFGPAARYKLPDTRTMNKDCWNAYLDAHTVERSIQYNLSEAQLEHAVNELSPSSEAEQDAVYPSGSEQTGVSRLCTEIGPYFWRFRLKQIDNLALWLH
ncbi:hypothetical protein Sjap_025313 [Stephania japonica]|uniref:Uncharacterized protein n=1 Tax=Stephania japonica TaxID=461633 RepID=A0AAP0E5X1_9MAGN